MKLADCPKCGLTLPAPDETCPKCGLIFAKWSAPRPVLGPYEYKMVQVAEHVVVREEALKGNEGAAYLQGVVNEQAQQGWEFFRVDEMSLSVSRPELFGTRSQGPVTRFYVVTFRRPPKSPGAATQPGV
jgi:hypothetical protein